MSETAGVTARLIEHARSLDTDTIPDDVVLVAKTCILDWIGCALAGASEPLVELLIREATEDSSAARASVIATQLRTSPRWAALINGAASHALDYDDTNFMLPSHPIHPTAPVLPAVLALGEERNAAGSDVLAAFITGVETECRMGAVLGVSHYAAGWHSTATLGTFGSAAACAHLLGLEAGGWPHLFGIASTEAAGLKSAFGSMSKPLQTGRAAENGVLAAKLAAKGFTSTPLAIEAAQGFASTHHATFRPEALDEVGDRFMIIDTVFKYHASCYFTHSAIEAARLISEGGAVMPSEIGRVKVVVPAQHLDVCNIAEPSTGLEGKFSLRATVAMALLGDDTADPAAYLDERMRAPELLEMRDKVTVIASPDVDGTETRVEVALGDGSSRSELVDVGVPASNLKRQWDSIVSKFRRLASPVVGELVARRIEDMVLGLDNVTDVGELVALCQAPR